ncbi:cupin [Paraburkholderia sp. ZP32-5]|uniref:cupin n=1 Tax=Paraburkholderia sp. ZP32-5 TaxID=2883245 RepID=UPI001F41A4E3|nr:cupin [Paraburkholderia sp. ZP32-5]
MPHEKDLAHWHEPAGHKKAGFGEFKKQPTPYDLFMESEGVPVFRDIGIKDVRDLPMVEWKRKGGRGHYIQLLGTETKWGCYVVEVPAGSALNPEKHMFEEIYWVVEGRGTTEVWLEGEGRKHVFEWQAGSMFSIPMNAWFRIVDGSNSGAVLLAGNTAPNVMNQINNVEAVFNNPFVFRDRFSADEDFYKPRDDIETDPVRGLARRRTNLITDAVNCELPLDNRRSPGYRRVEPFMTENCFYFWIGQHEQGRYSKAHAHTSAAVLICLKGEGYTYSWPEECGETPWADGRADKVRRLDYGYGGIVTAAPGGARWYHQHFSTSKDPFRLTAWFGPHNPGRDPGAPGSKHNDYTAQDVGSGGTAIPYWMEDPYIRQEYEARLAKNGVQSRMDSTWYVKPEKNVGDSVV